MKNLFEYCNEVNEGVVNRRNNIVQVGSLQLQFYPDHIFYVIKGDSDLSIYKDGSFKPPRSNEIYLKDAAKHGVPQVFVNIFAKFFAAPDKEQAIEFVVNSLENLYKTHVKESSIGEVDIMRKLKITTEVDLEETEGLYNTTGDRWSRRAKHQLSKNELQSAAEVSEFSKGDTAIYEGNEVEVRIPVGPNKTTGIMLEGHLKMVKRTDLQTLEEAMGVMGNMKPLGPINRIMQLAGLEHSGAIVEDDFDKVYPDTEQGAIEALGNMSTHDVNGATARHDPSFEGVWLVTLPNGNRSIVYLKGHGTNSNNDFETMEAESEVNEAVGAGTGTMFNQLLTANTNNPAYKNNPQAAKIATIGQVLAGLQGLMTGLPTNLPPATLNHVKMIPGIGAELIKTATAMTKPNTTMTKPTATAPGVTVKK